MGGGGGGACLLSPWMTEVEQSMCHHFQLIWREKTTVFTYIPFTHTCTYIFSFDSEYVFTLNAAIISVLVFHLRSFWRASIYHLSWAIWWAQYCAAFARYDYITVYHKHFHINNLCATAATRQINECTGSGHTHKVAYNYQNNCNYCVIQNEVSVFTCFYLICLRIVQFNDFCSFRRIAIQV